MSNIPSSAMPHAWAHDEAEREQEDQDAAAVPSIRPIVIAGAISALLLYWMVRR